MSKMLITTETFNPNYFEIGEPIQVLNQGKITYELILSVDHNSILTVRVEWDSPMCGSSGNREKHNRVWLNDILEGKTKIYKMYAVNNED